eukprot:1146837-Pelagomonas_calceolata.AAC.6
MVCCAQQVETESVACFAGAPRSRTPYHEHAAIIMQNPHSNAVLMMHVCLHMHHGMLQRCQRGSVNFSASLATLPSLAVHTQ